MVVLLKLKLLQLKVYSLTGRYLLLNRRFFLYLSRDLVASELFYHPLMVGSLLISSDCDFRRKRGPRNH